MVRWRPLFLGSVCFWEELNFLGAVILPELSREGKCLTQNNSKYALKKTVFKKTLSLVELGASPETNEPLSFVRVAIYSEMGKLMMLNLMHALTFCMA